MAIFYLQGIMEYPEVLITALILLAMGLTIYVVLQSTASRYMQNKMPYYSVVVSATLLYFIVVVLLVSYVLR
jgi:hypothetical protein